MRAPLSIIIPTLNAAGTLPETIMALMEGLESGLVRELIISDGGSEDATREIADDVGAIWVAGGPSRGGQLARGVAASGGEWVLLLHADTLLTVGWSDVVAEALADKNQAGYFRLRFRTPRLAGRWVSAWANFRSRMWHLPYGDQGFLISRALLDEIGGVPDVPLMEDVTLSRRLNGQLNLLNATAETSFERYQRDGVFKRGRRNIWLLLCFLRGADPEDLAKRYFR